MSLYSTLSTAISGMNAQAEALNHISDNIANSQTLGYKRLDTRFEELVTSVGTRHHTGAVLANEDATTTIQGGIQQVENPLALALNGSGFFSVARPAARGADGAPVFDRQAVYSRAGDFRLDAHGHLVNGSGDVLQGWTSNAAGVPDATRLAPIQVERGRMPPTPTTRLDLSANLPAGGAGGTSQAQIRDSLGALRPLDLTWTPGAAPDTWTLGIAGAGSWQVAFGANGAPAGTIGEIRDAGGAVIGRHDPAAPGRAAIAFTSGGQPITLDLGAFGGSAGVTQFGGGAYTLRSLGADGAPAGEFASVAIRDDGRVVAHYDNGESRTIAQVPVVTFADPDALERLSGQAFALTEQAGTPSVVAAGSAGAARLETGAVERSNVDMAAEFSRLIIAQRAYTANTRVVTTTDELLQDTINLKR